MTEHQLNELYNEEMSASAPDMEALWEKIDGRLTEKETVSVQPKKKPAINLWRTGAFMAACAALFFVIPNIIRHDNSYSASEGIALNSNTPAVFEDAAADNACNDTADAPAVFEESIAEVEVTFTETSSLLSYSSLPFPDSYMKNVEFSGEPNGGEYFVEEDILVETECFIDAIVDNVYASPDGDCVYYELTAKSSYGEDDVGTYVTIASRSQYEMYIGREYLIPVKVTDIGLQTVFDGVPQIEVTADNGLVYYNGWETLNTESSQSILYPQNKVDDFFYDRMMFSSSSDIAPLIEKWKTIHKEE